MWRWVAVAGLLLTTMSCGSFCGAGSAVVEQSDYVFVHFWGSVHVHRAPPGTQIWEDANYQWAEVAMYRIGSGGVVLDPSRVDRLRGTGQGTGVSPLYGSCTGRYDSFHESSETEGVRVINDGRKVEVLAIAPWDLHTTSGYTGSFCPPAPGPGSPRPDPAAGILGGQYGIDPFTCVLEPDHDCSRGVDIPASTTPGITQSGHVAISAERATRFDFYEDYDYLDQLFDDLVWAAIVAAGSQADVSVSAPGLGPAPADGSITLDMLQNGSQVGSIKADATRGTVPRLTATWKLAASATLPLQVDAAYALRAGPRLTMAQTVYPAAAAPGSPTAGGATPTITGVAFHGSVSNPTIVITGQNLGSEPSPDPPGHVAGQGFCPANPADNGFDYGINLYIAFPGGNWSAGRYNPSAGETDCFDLVVSSFGATQVQFAPGPLYGQQSEHQMTPGSAFQVVVNGASFEGTVVYS